MSQDTIKKAIGKVAADLIPNNTIVGLGTGTTATFFIQSLIQRCHEGLHIQAVASSEASLQLARKGGIPLLDINQITHIDITVDGADEIDPQKQMIKGGGGAHVREKILANMSREMVVIVDETKLVSQLGKAKLPVEIIPFAYKATQHNLEKLGYRGKWRLAKDGSPFITENDNFIFDIHFETLRTDPQKDHNSLIQIPGVVDTGFFFHLAGRVIVGFFDGQIVVRS